jgi:DNA-binding transcriptional MocR family regulator
MQSKSTTPYAGVYREVFSRIAAGRYRPTHRIGISDLAISMGVSTTPVREALRQLAGRDLVVERHREGFYLAPLNAQAVAELYAAHGHWLDHALAMAKFSKTTRPPRDLWRQFDVIGRNSDNLAIAATRRYLGDRLRVLRRHETALVRHADHAARLREALAHADLETSRNTLVTFHAQCIALAEPLARAFEAAN